MDCNGLQSPVQEAIRLSENFIVVEVGNVFLFKGAGDGTPWLLHFHGNEVAALLAVACKVLSLAEGILTCLLEGTASRLGHVDLLSLGFPFRRLLPIRRGDGQRVIAGEGIRQI